jgi:hypothetical protein
MWICFLYNDPYNIKMYPKKIDGVEAQIRGEEGRDLEKLRHLLFEHDGWHEERQLDLTALTSEESDILDEIVSKYHRKKIELERHLEKQTQRESIPLLASNPKTQKAHLSLQTEEEDGTLQSIQRAKAEVAAWEATKTRLEQELGTMQEEWTLIHNSGSWTYGRYMY